MPKIDVYNIEGKKVSTIELNDNVFGIKPNEKVIRYVLIGLTLIHLSSRYIISLLTSFLVNLSDIIENIGVTRD